MTGKRWVALAVSGCILLLCVGSALAVPAESFLKGDLNNDGAINSADARLLWRYLDNGYTLSAEQLACADMNGNGLINTIDAKLLWQAACGNVVGTTTTERETTSQTVTTTTEEEALPTEPEEDDVPETTTSVVTTTTAAPTTTTKTTTTTAAPTTTTTEGNASTKPTAQSPSMPEAVSSPPATTLLKSTIRESTYMRNIRIRAESSAGSETYDCTTRKGLQLGIAAVVKYEMGAARYAVNSTEGWKAQAVVSYSRLARDCYSDSLSPTTYTVRTSPIDLNDANDKRIYDAVGEVLGVKVMLSSPTSAYGKLCHCFYFASAAGATSSCHNVWTEYLPYAQSVWSPETVEWMQKYPTSGDFDRTYSYTIEEIMEEMESYLGQTLYRETREDAFSLYATKWDGPYMARSNLYYLSGGQKVYVTGMQLRSGLGLGTHALLVTAEKDGVMSVQMRGYGHGCGLSQAGAAILANEYGWTYDQIVAHYFSITETSDCQIYLPNF